MASPALDTGRDHLGCRPVTDLRPHARGARRPALPTQRRPSHLSARDGTASRAIRIGPAAWPSGPGLHHWTAARRPRHLDRAGTPCHRTVGGALACHASPGRQCVAAQLYVWSVAWGEAGGEPRRARGPVADNAVAHRVCDALV